MTWRRQVRDAARKAGQNVQRVTVQGFARARQAGRVAAHKVIALQKAAGLPDRYMRRSAAAVAQRPMARQADAAWRDAYADFAAARVPGMTPRQPQSEIDLEAGQ